MTTARQVAALALLTLAGSARAQRSLPAWTKGATCYEVFVRSFQDSDGDGVGDINGLIARLDYINDGKPSSSHSLGAKCIWLMPVAESPSYHGYDVSNYYKVQPAYGTNAQFKRLVAESHRRGIKVLVDMVLNHSSSQHPYFQAALHDTASPYRGWYRWASPKPTELNPWGQSNWHKSPVRDEWYYGFFWGGMPDLNYTNPAVVAEAKKIARYWLEEMGVDGFRLDAVPYLVEEPDAIVHSAGTHAVLRDYGSYVRRLAPQSYTVGEVSDGTTAMLTYYPEQLDSYFAFELADSLIAGVRSRSARGILPTVLRLQSSIPGERYSPFLRNHDQPRTMTELGGDVEKARVAATLLLTMPGVPFVYYGEEIGMSGAKPDERLRTPMQWSGASEAGFTSGRPWEALQPDSLVVTVASEDTSTSSLLNLYRRLIHLRAQNRALASGVLIPLHSDTDAIAAYLRREGKDIVLVVANLGSAALPGGSFTIEHGTLRAGDWRLRNLLDAGHPAALNVSAGAVDRVTIASPLAATSASVFALTSSHP